MNWDQIEGSWKQVKGKAKEQWSKLSDDELDQAAGRLAVLFDLRLSAAHTVKRFQCSRQQSLTNGVVNDVIGEQSPL